MSSPLLTVSKLSISFHGAPPVVENLSFSITTGERMGLLGLSGSGKSLTALALLGLLPTGASITSGTAIYHPKEGEAVDLFSLTDKKWEGLRGKEIGLVFQEPLTALNPTHRIGSQLMEAIEQLCPQMTNAQDKMEQLSTWLSRVELPAADHNRILAAYPHELSGGQRQRLLIALALLAEPRLLIADEPTTALDTITETAILQLIDRLREEMGMGLLFITHDLAVMERITDQALVLRSGKVVHRGSTEEILALPEAGLLSEVTDNSVAEKVAAKTVEKKNAKKASLALEVRELSINYQARKPWPWSKAKVFPAVNQISFSVAKGEWVALVGPSGCGKTSTARHLAGLIPAAAGTFAVASGRPQLVFQDPSSSLNPSHSLRTILMEVLQVQAGATSKQELQQKSDQLLETVGLPPASFAKRLPHQLSGGQRQRVAIARSLAADPQLLIADEAVSALDAPLRKEILRLLDRLRRDRQLGLLFISHDLHLVAEWADRVLIMDNGRIVEEGPAKNILQQPQSKLGRQLVAAAAAGTGLKQI